MSDNYTEDGFYHGTVGGNQISGIREITDWANLGTGSEEGELVAYSDGTNRAILSWDNTNSKWIFISSEDEWVLIEDWSSSSLNTDLWTSNSFDGSIDTVNNRITLSVTSGNNEKNDLTLNFSALHETQIKYDDAFLDSMPAASASSVILAIGLDDLQNDGVDASASITVGIRSEANGTLHISRYEDNSGTVTLNRIGDINTTDIYEIYVGSFFILEEEVQYQSKTYNKSDTTTLITKDATEWNTQTSNITLIPSIGLTMANYGASFSGGPYDIFIGKIYIKR